MIHLFKKGINPSSPTLLLLHGTGGDEKDLLPLAHVIDKDAAILSVRGNILENGMPRFFKRLAEGVFDEESLKTETENLYHFIKKSAEQYGFDPANVIALGYSNGANIAASLLYHYPNVLNGAILHHPMVPLRNIELPDLTNTPIFIGAGINDPICPAEESKELKNTLEAAGAEVTIEWGNQGHSLTQLEVTAAANWYRRQFH